MLVFFAGKKATQQRREGDLGRVSNHQNNQGIPKPYGGHLSFGLRGEDVAGPGGENISEEGREHSQDCRISAPASTSKGSVLGGVPTKGRPPSQGQETCFVQGGSWAEEKTIVKN